jgi:hypothetical protein
MRKNDAIMEILSPYAPDEITAAERKLELYPAWKRLLRVMDSIFEVSSFKDPYSDRVQGGVSLPQAEKIIMLKECHPEYQRVQRNCAAIERELKDCFLDSRRKALRKEREGLLVLVRETRERVQGRLPL